MSHSHFAANDGEGRDFGDDDDDAHGMENVPVAIIWPVVLSRTVGSVVGMRDLEVYHGGYSNMCVIEICDVCFEYSK